MSGGSGGGGDSTTTQKSEPWSGQQNYLKAAYREAKTNLNNPMEYYQGDQVAPFSPETEQALAMQTQRAQTGSPLVNLAQGEAQKSMSGDYLDAGNPHFQQMADRIRGQVQPAIDARFATAGSAGSPLANRALGMGLGDAIGGLAYQNYGDERTRMMQNQALAPELANQDYYDIGRLSEVGATRENLNQQQINAAMQQHQFEQMEPWQRLQMYNQIIQGSSPGAQITTNSSGAGGRSGLAMGATGALGGAATGAAMGSMIGPWGTAGGALVGAGLGALSGM